MLNALLEEVVAPCAKCTPEGRCAACKGEALDYYRAAINAINPNLMAKELARGGDSDAGGYVGRDLRELAERIKQHLLQHPEPPTRAQVMRAVAPVLFNVSNYPRAGESIGPLAGKIADAVLELLTGESKAARGE